MIQKCYVCKDIYGTKEPWDDFQVSHGLCDACFPKEMQRIESELSVCLEEGENEPFNFRGNVIGADHIFFDHPDPGHWNHPD